MVITRASNYGFIDSQRASIIVASSRELLVTFHDPWNEYRLSYDSIYFCDPWLFLISGRIVRALPSNEGYRRSVIGPHWSFSEYH